ncbi:hypothetical protein CLV46_2845 [Diaminobutyricimonas aerilata]|uniref:Excreted virulence factor EspC (Type VII ESX diderm) n=1 Tax=Diaminobutyricimonas aerilata TaxID=1162967 RepID=A0A2M9CMX6_9MICO|nr:hypothetical protein [Diaminobutyricimonas aerilata]PJJ73259.1 hypothetical protein CLV46_2845 [Diaminobutyricimonas aerilata]
MGDRVWLNMEDLDEVNAGLRAAITEFTDVAQDNDRAEQAAGNPAGRGELQARVGDFESGWDHNREQLTEKLTKTQEHLQAIVDGFRELDAGLQSSMSDAEYTLLNNPGPDNRAV